MLVSTILVVMVVMVMVVLLVVMVVVVVLVVLVVRNRMEGFVLVVINEDRSDECDIRNNEQSFGVES